PPAHACLKSVAQGACLNEPKFCLWPTCGCISGAENEMYRPVAAASFNTATVAISPLSVTTASFVRGPASGVATDPVVAPGDGANPYSALLLANAESNILLR